MRLIDPQRAQMKVPEARGERRKSRRIKESQAGADSVDHGEELILTAGALVWKGDFGRDALLIVRLDPADEAQFGPGLWRTGP